MWLSMRHGVLTISLIAGVALVAAAQSGGGRGVKSAGVSAMDETTGSLGGNRRATPELALSDEQRGHIYENIMRIPDTPIALSGEHFDVPDDEYADIVRRVIAEEIGRGARTWEPILSYYSSPGFTDERVYLFCATDLHAQSARSEENERIEIVAWPLAQLDRAIEESGDAKTVIGLLWLQRRLSRGG